MRCSQRVRAFILASLATLGAINLAAQAQRITLVTGEWAPYVSATMDRKGFFMEITDATFKEMGTAYDISFVPWSRAEAMVKEGTAFAALPYAPTEERMSTFDFSDEVAKSTGKLFAIKGGRVATTFSWSSYTDLKPFTIGGVRGYWYEPIFKEAALFVDYANADDLNVKKLSNMRVDLMPMDELGGWFLIKKLDPTNVDKYFTLEKPLSNSSLRLMVSRSYPDSVVILARFNLALAKIRKNGVYDAILRKYNLKR